MSKHKIEFSNITTRAGDEGKTGLINGERRFKSELLFFVLGDIDEAGSAIGLARACLLETNQDCWQIMARRLLLIQKELLLMGGHLASPPPHKPYCLIGPQALSVLEEWQAEYMVGLKITGFIYPGAGRIPANLDLARAIVRRAERQLVRFIQEAHPIGHEANQRYLNRLSDYLFVCARHVAGFYGLNES